MQIGKKEKVNHHLSKCELNQYLNIFLYYNNNSEASFM